MCNYIQLNYLQCPETVLYIPNFITSIDEKQIVNYVNNAPKPKWTQLAHRRLLNYGGVPHKNGMIAESIPGWLQNYVDKINNLGLFETKNANHILVNEYPAGTGIMAHSDGPLFYPIISTISCDSHTILEFYNNSSTTTTTIATNPSSTMDQMELNSHHRQLVCKLLIEPRSLLILKHDMYTKYMHGISDLYEDVIDEQIKNLNNCGDSYKIGDKVKRNKRISLTIRHVPKTSRLKFKTGV